jgi:hypothetical protein
MPIVLMLAGTLIVADVGVGVLQYHLKRNFRAWKRIQEKHVIDKLTRLFVDCLQDVCQSEQLTTRCMYKQVK